METQRPRTDVLDPYVQDLIRHKARRLCHRHDFADHEPEDVQQELILHLLERLRLFDAERASFHTFATRVVDSRIATLIRDRGRLRRRPRSLIASLDQQFSGPDGNGGCPGDRLSDADGGRRVLAVTHIFPLVPLG